MGFYFEDQHSMHVHAGMKVERTLESIVRRYLGNNPAHPPTFRAYCTAGILRGKDYRYHANFNEHFPAAHNGQFAYAWGKIWADAASELKFDVDCHSPTLIWCNRERVFRSDIFQERHFDQRTSLSLPLKAGWNHVVLRFCKTDGGFGGIFGTWLGKLPYYFLLPVPDREGQEGWLFTGPLDTELAVIPGAGVTEANTGVAWLPQAEWPEAQRQHGQFGRIYGLRKAVCGMAWARATFLHPGRASYVLKGRSSGPLAVFIDDEEVFTTSKRGAFTAKVAVPFGPHNVMVRCDAGSAEWGFALELHDEAGQVDFSSPFNVTGTKQPWMFAGPFPVGAAPAPATLHDFKKLVPALDGDTYWRLDLPATWVRIYNENPLFGRWNYPLGVTLYGLLHSAKAAHSAEAENYVVEHVQFCCDLFAYAMWDRRQHGGATNVHHLLTSIDSLDDCGSFGSCLLEVLKHHRLRGARPIADYVADYITNRQIRLPDGTFFRKNLMHVFHEDTMWADDLYMSVPFLCRYYQLTGEAKYIDDAARQFVGFKQHLFMPKLKLMAHVYDFKRGMATGIPWGRGNGWTIFSLSELLAVLPKNHALRPELLHFFQELCAGYLAQQDAQGMWHQVLDEHDSYAETSCTSMFTYAFARGVQFGWLETPGPYVRAVFKAWEALNRISVDRFGNVHGVCRGSEFSFQSEYYKRDLLWNLNDTHGIGIVLLAGVEVLRLMKALGKDE